MNLSETEEKIIEGLIDQLKKLMDELRPIKSKLNKDYIDIYEKVDIVLKNVISLEEKIKVYKKIGDYNLGKITTAFLLKRDEILTKNIDTNLELKEKCENEVEKCFDLLIKIKPFQSKLNEEDFKYFETMFYSFDIEIYGSKIELYKSLGEKNMKHHLEKLTELEKKIFD